MRRAATWISQRARVVGHALARPLRGRRDQRFLHRVLRGGEVAEAADDGAEHLRRELAQQVLGIDASSGGGHVTRLRAARSSPARTSIAMLSGAPPGPGAAEPRAAIS